MNVTTISGFRKNSKEYFDRIINDQAPLLITRTDGQTIVAIPLNEFNALSETDYLLANPKNKRRLTSALKEVRTGKAKQRQLIET